MLKTKFRIRASFFNFIFSSFLLKMEVEEEKQHEGIQQYYITKIEALQV